MIGTFKINRLHSHRNFEIAFDSPYNVLLSENGCGKTTILSLLYAILNKDVSKLQKTDFESIEISFLKNPKKLYKLEKSQLQYNSSSPAQRYLKSKLTEPEYNHIIQLVISGKSYNEIRQQLSSTRVSFSIGALRDLVEERATLEETNNTNNFFQSIENNNKSVPLYLPTYRRVEENLENLGVNPEEFKSSLINFGLDDVTNQIETIRKQILQVSTESFNSVSGDLLTKMINGFPRDATVKKLIKKHQDLVPLILNRIGNTLSQDDQNKIKDLVISGGVFEQQNESLAYFLAKLIDAYQKQKDLDGALKNYANICSEYFTSKDVRYDESRITVEVLAAYQADPLNYNQLSSGEKQIASLFASIYLYGDRNLAILFDEPELSLSVEWQERLLTDIIKSGRCTFLLAMTHSPFIFKNLVEYTSDINKYFSPA